MVTITGTKVVNKTIKNKYKINFLRLWHNERFTLRPNARLTSITNCLTLTHNSRCAFSSVARNILWFVTVWSGYIFTEGSLMEIGFDFKCCWTCKYSILDIGIKAFVCHKTGRIIGQMNERYKEHIPTKCGLYEQ